MKRKTAIMGGLLLAASSIYVGSQLMAQQQPRYTQPAARSAPAAAQTTTRIAVLNLGQVIHKYEKYKRGQMDVKAVADRYQADYEKLKTQMSGRQAQLKNPKTLPSQREAIEKVMRDLQRDIQDKAEEAKKDVAKRQFDLLVAIYKEVHTATEAFAKSRHIELVMHYNDGVKEDQYLPQIFQQKLTNNACFPMYAQSNLDITDEIVNMLNMRDRQQSQAAPAVPSVPRAPGR